MVKLNLTGEERKVLGRKVKKLRREGLIPANIYGKKTKSKAISVSFKDFQKIFSQAGETTLIELGVGKSNFSVLVRNVQKNPISDDLLHIDFQEVDLKEKVVAQVPVEVVGESPAEKQGLGTLVQQINEIEVEALPTDIPEKFEIDAANLTEVDQAIFVKDIKVDEKKVSIKEDLESIVVKVEELRKEEEVPAVEPEGEEGATAVEGEKPVEEGQSEEKTSEEGK